MKLQFSLILLAALSASNVAFGACGGRSTDTFTGKEAALAARNGELTCLSGGSSSPANLNIFAIYRCMGSPLRAQLNAFGETLSVKSVTQLNTESFEIQVDGARTSLLCQLQSDEAANEAATKKMERLSGDTH